ncbi:hypothetical protein [Vibrio hyugaensis]|uniref:hypothetical protein n=1 Tax=Vibrio hyugaensis TaxID=1534743 RepID=UPI000B018E56|nr:hypothetical protein [Vibrio hyugaensis]
MTSSQSAICLGSHTLLTIFDLEPLDLQIAAASANQVILAEPSGNEFAVWSESH